MSNSRLIRALVTTLALASGMLAMTPAASAREGAQSVGHGIKCYTAAVTNADGTVTYQRICYKSV